MTCDKSKTTYEIQRYTALSTSVKSLHVTRFAKTLHLHTPWQRIVLSSMDSSINKLFTSTPQPNVDGSAFAEACF